MLTNEQIESTPEENVKVESKLILINKSIRDEQ